MPDAKDDLSPTGKDAAEGARDTDPAAHPAPTAGGDESHLGAGGDPVEGAEPDGD